MLKYLKGARILADCETGALHMDLGDGKCMPIGGGNAGSGGGGYDLVIDHSDSERQPILTHGSYAAAVEKMEANIPPLVCVLRFRYTEDGRNSFGEYETVRSIGLLENGTISVDVGDMNYYNISPDNSVERVEE